MFIFAFILLNVSAFGENASIYEEGMIQDTLRKQNLSHAAFHTGMKRTLGLKWQTMSGILNRDRRVAAIVGVEYGEEALELGKMGYKLMLFEPNKEFSQVTSDKLSEQNIQFEMFNVALSDSRGEGTIEYGGSSHAANFGLFDDFLNGSITILSIDTQGNEYDVLQGATHIFKNMSLQVEMMWIEISTLICDTKLTKLLKLVDRTHVIMDFVWWGKPKSESDEEFSADPWNLGHYTFCDGKQSIDSYVNLFCSQQDTFSWLQTDLLAIDRRLISPRIMKSLSHMVSYCWKHFDCPLHKLTG